MPTIEIVVTISMMPTHTLFTGQRKERQRERGRERGRERERESTPALWAFLN
jgi:hypothetical protein